MAQFIAIFFAFFFAAWGLQAEVVDLLSRLEKTYARIADVQALVVINQLSEEGQEGRTVRVKLQALVGRGILRIEYLEPLELYGQIITLEGEELAQYLPESHTILKMKLSPSDVVTRLLRSADLKTALRYLRSVDAELEVRRNGVGLFGDSATMTLKPSVSRLAQGPYAGSPLALSLADYPFQHTLLEKRVYDLTSEQLVIDVRSKTYTQLAQRIWLDPQSLLVRRLETRLFLRFGGKLREIKIIADLERISINQNLTREDLLRLPADARIITPPK